MKKSAAILRKDFNDAIKAGLFPEMRGIPFDLREKAFRDLGQAWDNYFNSNNHWNKPKAQKRQNSFAIRNTRVERDRVRITKLGWVRLKERDYIPTTASGADYTTYQTVTKRAGRWFISVGVREECTEVAPLTDVVGVDVGIHALSVCSDGRVFENPRPLRKAQRKLGRLYRELNRRQKGSNNWKKTKRKIQREHYHIANIRSWHQHQISHYVTDELRPTLIVVEDLNVKGMLLNHHLAQAISDVGFAELRRQITYKAEGLGIYVLAADRFWPSSKTCSQCGAIKDDLELSDRLYCCPHCGLEMDRDLNAAKNLANYGREWLLGKPLNEQGLPVELEA
jgi:putative transposase